MRRIYLDTSVSIVLLFGKERERDRFAHVKSLFEKINAGQVEAVISLYTLQEICTYCFANFPEEIAGNVSRIAILNLVRNRLALFPLPSRQERMTYSRMFTIRDASDRTHVISAFLSRCEAIVAYDEHFRDSADVMPYLHPEELLTRLEDSQGTNSLEL